MERIYFLYQYSMNENNHDCSYVHEVKNLEELIVSLREEIKELQERVSDMGNAAYDIYKMS